MTTFNNRFAAAVFSAGLFVTGCSASPADAQKSSKSAEAIKQYKMKGEITGLDAAGHVATIKHEKIEGFMGAMTMGYQVKDEAEFKKLSVGEPITATVYVQGDDMWVGKIRKADGK